MPSPPRVGNECTCFCSTVFQSSTSRSMSLLEMPTRQHTSTTKSKSTKICTILQLPLCKERCHVRSIRYARTFKSRLHIDYSTNNHSSQLRSASDLDCCFMAILSWRKPTWTPNCQKNSGATLVSEYRVTRKDKKRTARTLRPLKTC